MSNVNIFRKKYPLSLYYRISNDLNTPQRIVNAFEDSSELL